MDEEKDHETAVSKAELFSLSCNYLDGFGFQKFSNIAQNCLWLLCWSDTTAAP